MPGYANTLREAMPKMYADEGLTGFYKGLVPLWLRQIPYTMMKFACFERTVELLYKYVVPKPRQDCSKAEQLVVTFAAGYIAGVFCAVVSHPADSVSFCFVRFFFIWTLVCAFYILLSFLFLWTSYSYELLFCRWYPSWIKRKARPQARFWRSSASQAYGRV